MLSTTTIYAIRAVGYLASLGPAQKADSAEISAATNVPRRFLSKILTALKFHRLLNATRGIGGGFWLSRDPDTIPLYEVVAIFEDLPRLEVCPMGREICSERSGCPLHSGWKQVREAYFKFLKNTMFGSFIGVEFNDRFKTLKAPSKIEERNTTGYS